MNSKFVECICSSGREVPHRNCPVHGGSAACVLHDEIEEHVAEIRALDVEEGKADDLDDRIGIRHRRNDLERWLGHRVVERWYYSN